MPVAASQPVNVLSAIQLKQLVQEGGVLRAVVLHAADQRPPSRQALPVSFQPGLTEFAVVMCVCLIIYLRGCHQTQVCTIPCRQFQVLMSLGVAPTV